MPAPDTAAIVLAGGLGTRLRSTDNKAYLAVAGRSLLAWSVQPFQDSALIDDIVVVTRETDTDRALGLLQRQGLSKVRLVVPGGPTRHASEREGLEALADRIEAGRLDVVCVHDAARPFVTQRLLSEVVAAARADGGAVPCIGVPEPVLLRAVAAGGAQPVGTADLRRAQTPQAFRADALLEAHRRAAAEGFEGLDTASCVERFASVDARAVPGDADNIKVTYGEDLPTAEAIAARWEPGPA